MPTAYITVPRDAAPKLARTLVEERLAACVNRLPCESVYRWSGEVETAEEAVLLVKTTDDGWDALEARTVELHPHDVPCVERIDETAVLEEFAAWRDGAVGEES